MRDLEKAELLERTADLIDERGHWKGYDDGPRETRMCVLTGLSQLTSTVRVIKALEPLYDDLGHDRVPGWGGVYNGVNVSDITRWNDRSSAQDVTSRLRKVAGDIRSKAAGTKADYELVNG